MQFILTQEEMDAYTATRIRLHHLEQQLPDKELLQTMCTHIADSWATWKGWSGDHEARPWGCIVTKKYDHYCDKCPVESICPMEHKSWSK